MIGLKEIALIVLIIFLLFNKEIISYFTIMDERILRGKTEKVSVNKIDEIPKVIYKTGIDDYNYINSDVVDIFEKTLNLNPGFVLYYYSDNDSRELIKNNFNGETLTAYDTLVPGAYKADLFRYCVLYLYGGIYSDLTQRFTTPFETFIDLKNDELYLVRDMIHHAYKKQGTTHGIQISFMATKPGNKIYLQAIKGIIDNVKNRYYGENPLDPTGPRHFYKILLNHDGDYKTELKETGKRVIDKDGKTIYYNKMKGHQKIILKNKPHYSDLWFKGKIYK